MQVYSRPNSVTRNHYLHEFFPHTLAYASCDGEASHGPLPPPPRPRMRSYQAPRHVRLAESAVESQKHVEDGDKSITGDSLAGSDALVEGLQLKHGVDGDTLVVTGILDASTDIVKTVRIPVTTLPTRRPSFSDPAVANLIRHQPTVSAPAQHPDDPLPPLQIKCHVRTRIPTPHGHVFLYLYKNNRDEKEHLAFVADQRQMDAHPGEIGPASMPFIRSETLDAEWREGETEIERIVRGAYLGRLSSSSSTVSTPFQQPPPPNLAAGEDGIVPPLVRIHSECFTGETIGSQRCDCGEQLDEAFRLITEAKRGVVVYLRQEGRGIGLLEKMRAYNLQDLGHDTVTANLLLGHGADLRVYDIAGAILRDLAIPEVRLLTNNPDKIIKIEQEGVKVVERVEMVPRSWAAPGNTTIAKKKRRPILSGAALLALAAETKPPHQQSNGAEEEEDDDDDEDDDAESMDSDAAHFLRRSGVGMIGGSTTRSAELDKYLRTKIERMGHMLSLPPTPPPSRTETPRRKSSSSSTSLPSSPLLHPLSSSITSLLDI